MNIKLIAGSVRMLLVLTIATGVAYPLIVTLAARIVFPVQTTGSIMYVAGKPVGSSLLAQPFSASMHFSPRPSACNYATVPSGASNLAVTNVVLRKSMDSLAAFWGAPQSEVPADLLFNSGSGLDPHISPDAAALQLDRLALVYGLSGAQKLDIGKKIALRTEKRQWGLFGQERINVLLLNCDLDNLHVTTGKF